MINYFKAAERLLAQRGNLEQALENLGRRRELASTQAKAERDIGYYHRRNSGE